MIINAFNLEGKIALVTGCNTGLCLAQVGCDIIGVNRAGPADTQAKVEMLGRRFWSIQANLTQPAVVPQVVEQAVAQAGRIDILVNNAGIIRHEDALAFSEQDWDDVMNINIKSLFFLSQQVARKFIAQGKGSKIINIASMLSFLQGGIRACPPTRRQRRTVMGLTKLMANESEHTALNVNAIAPGYMATNNTEQLRNDTVRN